MRNIIVQVLLTSLKAMHKKKGKANPVHFPLKRKYRSILLQFFHMYCFLRKISVCQGDF